jgi:HEAT repeat protein
MSMTIATRSILAILLMAPVTMAQDEAEAPPELPELVERDPLVLAIIESDPAQPGDLIQAAESMLDLGRPQLAQGYLAKLIKSPPAASELLRLHRRFGSSLFIRFSQEEQIQPEGRQVAHAVLEAAHRWAHDPRRVDTLVQKVLDGDSAPKRAAALDQLQRVPTDAVTPLMRALASPASSTQAARARGALATLGRAVEEPLIGFARAPDERLQAEAIWVLARMEADRAVPHLLRPYLSSTSGPALRAAATGALRSTIGSLPSASEGQAMLWRHIGQLMSGPLLPSDPDHEGRITVWRWDAQQQTCTARQLAAPDAAVMVAAELAYDLHHLAPDRSDYQRMYHISSLEAAKRISGFSRPLPQGTDTARGRAAAAGPQVVEQVLKDAMDSRHDGAAVAAAEILGQTGDASLLPDPLGRRRPLAAALCSPNPWVRIAAARSIMQIDPRQPYPGASHLTQLIRLVISTRGTPRVLVGSGNPDVLQNVPGYLRELGFDVDLAVTGRHVTKMAGQGTDYVFLMIHDSIEGPTVTELLQNLRQHPYTGILPLGILPRPGRYARSEQLARDDPLTIVSPLPTDRDSLTRLADRLVRLAGRDAKSTDQRLGHALEAMTWLRHLADDRQSYGYYDVGNLEPSVVAALDTPELTASATNVLSRFGTPRAQATLLDMVLQDHLPLDHRQAAADALVQAIGRMRVQLTPSQIEGPYQLYQQGGQLDEETRRLLGVVFQRIDSSVREPAPDALD